MATTFGFFWDSALTEQVTALDPIYALQKNDGSSGPQQFRIYVGSLTEGKKIQADSNPGVDQIMVSITDSNAATGEPVEAVKLAASSGGLAAAVAGEALGLGIELLSGAANVTSFWAEIEDQTSTVGTYTDLKLISNMLVEVAA